MQRISGCKITNDSFIFYEALSVKIFKYVQKKSFVIHGKVNQKALSKL